MALKYLELTAETNNYKGECVYQEWEKLSEPGDGNIFLLPDNAGKVESYLVNLIPSPGSSGLIEYSLSNREDIIAGNGIWKTWDSGIVTTTTDDVLFPVSAIRQVNISGTTTLELRVI